MTQEQRILALCTALASAVYLLACVHIGIAIGDLLAAKVATACAGFCYLAYLAQLMSAPRMLSAIVVVVSIVLGIGAGVLLLVGA